MHLFSNKQKYIQTTTKEWHRKSMIITICSNLAITIIISYCQESLSFFIGQYTSTTWEPLQEKSAGENITFFNNLLTIFHICSQIQVYKCLIIHVHGQVDITTNSSSDMRRSSYLSSSSSINPLASLSRMLKMFFTSWGLFLVMPHSWKNFLGLKESGAVMAWKQCNIQCQPHMFETLYKWLVKTITINRGIVDKWMKQSFEMHLHIQLLSCW